MADQITPPVTPAPGAVHMDTPPPAPAPVTPPAPAAPAATPTVPVSANALGVTDEQFTKYFDAATGAYNWPAHAREADFKLAQKAGPAAAEPAAVPAAPGTPAEAQTLVQQAGLDFTVLEETIRSEGKLTEADYKAFADIGVPDKVVNQYISGLKAAGAQRDTAIETALGGPEGVAKVKAWATEKLTEAESKEYNKMLSGDAWQVATAALLARAGLPPVERGAAVQGPNAASPGTTGAQPYANEAELQVDIRNPLYKTDPAFRAQVVKRAAASTYSSNVRAHTTGL